MRIVGISDVMDVFQFDSGIAKAEFNGVKGQLPRRERHRPLAVLDVREPLFLRGGKDDAVLHQASGRVMIDGVDAEGVHKLVQSQKSKIRSRNECRSSGSFARG